jgi:hypothetical protein
MKKFDEIAEKNPFRVPDGYFGEVNARILASTSGEEKPVVRKTGVFRLKPYLLAAASVAGFVLLSYTAVRLLAPGRALQHERAFVSDELFNSGLDEIDIYEIEENITNIPVSADIHGVSKSEIIEYLMLDNIEINDIYELL